MNPIYETIFNITTIIGITGLFIIGIILSITLDTPIYGCAIIGFTILSLFAYMIYKRIILRTEYNRAIREERELNNIVSGVTVPYIIQLQSI